MAEQVVAEHFATRPQQRETATLGMWIFLAGEMLLFGGLFAGYTVYRLAYSEAFASMSHHLYLWLATANTAVLLTSSLTMAFAVHAAMEENRRGTRWFLVLTIALGVAFLAIKGVEYYLDYREDLLPPLRFDPAKLEADAGVGLLFLSLYLLMTGLHALHMIGGLVVLTGLVVLLGRRSVAALQHTVENVGLYWHFVDVVWIFLFPLLYLIGVQ